VHETDSYSRFSNAVLSKLTQPFLSTKSSGTGLGLAITKGIVNAHGGELFIQSDVLGGTRVSVKLPVANYGAWGIS
jgi:signal transduction histidine kinase